MNDTESVPVISNTIAKIKLGLEVAEVFRAKYESKLPLDLGNFILYSEEPSFMVNLECHDEDRDTTLTLLGDIFGRTDWKAQLEYRGRHFNWTKFVDGCRIVIESAQKMNQPESFPVDPRQFPIQIEYEFPTLPSAPTL